MPKQDSTDRKRVALRWLMAGTACNAILLAADIVGLFHLPGQGNLILGVVLALSSFGFFVASLIVASALQPMDDPVHSTPPAEWEDDLSTYAGATGIALLASPGQKQLLEQLFAAGTSLRNEAGGKAIPSETRRSLLSAMEALAQDPDAAKDATPIFFPLIPGSESYLLSSLMRGLRALGGPNCVPLPGAKFGTAVEGAEALKFDEMRYLPHHCRNALTVLSLLENDQDRLLRPSSDPSPQGDILVRPASSDSAAESKELVIPTDDFGDGH